MTPVVNGTFIVQIATANDNVVRAVVGVDGKGSATDYVYTAEAPGTGVVNIYTTPWDTAGGQTSTGMRIEIGRAHV